MKWSVKVKAGGGESMQSLHYDLAYAKTACSISRFNANLQFLAAFGTKIEEPKTRAEICEFVRTPRQDRLTAKLSHGRKVPAGGRVAESTAAMAITYYKRYRMETVLVNRTIEEPQLPKGYHFVAWDPSLVDCHAHAKFLSFRNELDANVFACLGEMDGCSRLMSEIAHKEGFLPDATWLVACDLGSQPEFVGTIQGIRDANDLGAVQNLGIVPEHRGRGLGGALMLQALHGFRRAGLRRVYLEVTAQNDGAVRLYQRLGFYKAKVVYKAVEQPTPAVW